MGPWGYEEPRQLTTPCLPRSKVPILQYIIHHRPSLLNNPNRILQFIWFISGGEHRYMEGADGGDTRTLNIDSQRYMDQYARCIDCIHDLDK